MGRERAKHVNCTVVQCGGQAEDWPFLVEGISSEGLSAKWWDGNCYKDECSIPNTNLRSTELQFRHFLKGSEFTYSSALSFALRELLFWPWVVVLCDSAVQSIFNLRPISRNERLAILKRLVELTCEQHDYKVSSTTITSLLHPIRTWSHPQIVSVVNYYELVLASLKASGDLESKGIEYRLAPKALWTIAEYECEERRHRAIISQQRAIIGLTFVLALIGAVQAIGALAPLLSGSPK